MSGDVYITWHRRTEQRPSGSRMVYYASEEEWAGWAIVREPAPKSQKYYRYQVEKDGQPQGRPTSRLRTAKERVEARDLVVFDSRFPSLKLGQRVIVNMDLDTLGYVNKDPDAFLRPKEMPAEPELVDQLRRVRGEYVPEQYQAATSVLSSRPDRGTLERVLEGLRRL